jgi:HK97 family phage portal protein
VPPRYANRLAAQQGVNMQTQGAILFQNHAVPGGMLSVPENIGQADADRLKEQWESMFSGANRGRVAVLGNGTKYERLPFTAVEGQMIEQLRWTAEVVCSTYHVPGYMVGVGPMPTHNNIEALLAQYYSQCLQVHLEGIELCLKEGLGIAENMRVKFDLDGLLRMDTATQYKSIADGIRGGFLTPNEARWKIDKKPIRGGDTVYLQEQDHSLQALAERDSRPDPFAKGAPAPAAKPPAPAEAPPANDNAMAREALAAINAVVKGLRDV